MTPSDPSVGGTFYPETCHRASLTRRQLLAGGTALLTASAIASAGARAGDDGTAVIRRYASLPDDPWAVCHGIRGMGRDFAMKSGGRAVDWLLETQLAVLPANGSGALGFELASRGARRVVLVERDLALVERLIALRDRLGAREVEVIRSDAIEAARQLAPGSFDQIFIDPPYREPLLQPALTLACRLLAPGGAIYAEAQAALADADLQPLGLRIARAGRAGRVHFHLLVMQQS